MISKDEKASYSKKNYNVTRMSNCNVMSVKKYPS